MYIKFLRTIFICYYLVVKIDRKATVCHASAIRNPPVQDVNTSLVLLEGGSIAETSNSGQGVPRWGGRLNKNAT